MYGKTLVSLPTDQENLWLDRPIASETARYKRIRFAILAGYATLNALIVGTCIAFIIA